MKLVPVTSSALREAGYDARRRILRLTFTSGAVYDYFGVPRAIYASLTRAASKGKYFSAHIRDRFDFVHIS